VKGAASRALDTSASAVATGTTDAGGVPRTVVGGRGLVWRWRFNRKLTRRGRRSPAVAIDGVRQSDSRVATHADTL
jgi:hypothetical protein